MGLYFTVSLFYGFGSYEINPWWKWLIFLTHWSFAILSIATLLGAVVALHVYLRYDGNEPGICSHIYSLVTYKNNACITRQEGLICPPKNQHRNIKLWPCYQSQTKYHLVHFHNILFFRQRQLSHAGCVQNILGFSHHQFEYSTYHQCHLLASCVW